MEDQYHFCNSDEKPGKKIWDDIHRHLKELSSDEIIDLYYRLRDACTISGREVCYPNIQHLHATTFEGRRTAVSRGNGFKIKMPSDVVE